MTHKEILTKAIKKATAGGLSGEYMSLSIIDDAFRYADTRARDHFVRGIIYNHEFAKALWGEGLYIKPAYEALEPPRDIHPWRYHLIHMVIAPDPIKYLGEHI